MPKYIMSLDSVGATTFGICYQIAFASLTMFALQ